MKAIISIVVVLAIAMAAVYYWGGYRTFDPSEQGRQAKAAIKPGMTWKQVIDKAGKGGKFRSIVVTTRKIRGEDVTDTILGPPVELNTDRIAAKLSANEMRDGFIIQYDFSQSVAFSVFFDSTGLVTDIQDNLTMADLLGTK